MPPKKTAQTSKKNKTVRQNSWLKKIPGFTTQRLTKKQRRVYGLVQLMAFLVAGIGTLVFCTHLIVSVLENTAADSFLSTSAIALQQVSLNYWVGLLVLAITALALLVASATRLSTKKALLTEIKVALLVFTFLSGALLSLPVSLVMRITDMKMAVKAISDDPGSISIFTDSDDIAAALEDATTTPTLLEANHIENSELLRNISFREDSGSFYREVLPDLLPKNLWPDLSLPDTSMLLYKDTLIFTRIDQNDFQKISGPLGKQMVADYFYPKSIKDAPSIEVIGRQEYLEFRDDQINQQLDDIDASIAQNNSQIAAKRRAMTDVIFKFYYGALSYSDAQRQYDSLQSQIAQLNQEIAELREIKVFVAAQKDSTPSELGIFLPEEDNSIKVVLDVTNPEALDNYLAILSHEYLHYTSYADDERFLLPFFEEGLTEYFGRKVVAYHTNKETKVGYPLILKVVEAMMTHLDEDAVADAYFTKDVDKLERILDDEFGSGFYKDSQFHFIMIPFADVDTAIKYANDVLSEMGDDEINLEDVREEIELYRSSTKPTEK